MESLKEAITSAEEASQVRDLITKSAFTPRAPAFTALINLCGKEKDADKALQVFETSQELNIEKNTYMYSSLISALGSSGKWELAFEFFEKMLEENSEICKPNTITYSALISACERAGQVEKAWEVFERMKSDGVSPDLITYSVLLTACEKENLWDKSIEIMDQMHAKSMHASQNNYSRVISALGEAGEVNQAIEIFLQLQLAGGEISLNLCNIMLSCLERNERGDLAYHLIRSMHENSIVGESVSYNMVLAALSKSFDPNVIPLMLEIYQMMKYLGVRVTTYTSSLLIKACERFNDPNTAIQLTHDFQQLNIPLDQATLEILNGLVRGV
jgi:pentatricopeptide repeat domain-containing protein 1